MPLLNKPINKSFETKNKIQQILNQNTEITYFNYELIKSHRISYRQRIKSTKCTMDKCFNFTKCNSNNFRIYIYQQPSLIVSDIYRNIIKILESSPYKTNNSDEACLFVSLIDTLDRDKLSVNYVKNLKELIPKLTYWNVTGRNHLIFNLYSGSWPDYRDNLEFDSNHAILIKASFSIKNYRNNFDISFPLFHSDLPFNNSSNQSLSLSTNQSNKYLLTFKGKRYLNGYGSETRNSLYHLNNDRDIILMTTCKHGYNWEEFKDSRCDIDNDLYDKYNYTELLYNSTFCLIPRGRRLATYRFLESLKAGCIPVILSNSWVLPFSEILDWNECVLFADERLLTQVI